MIKLVKELREINGTAREVQNIGLTINQLLLLESLLFELEDSLDNQQKGLL